MNDHQPAWPLFLGSNTPPVPEKPIRWPDAPPWRRFDGEIPEGAAEWKPPSMAGTREETIGKTYIADTKTRQLINAALFLRRPLLVTGNPGTGKSSLAFAVAFELGLGQVLYWPVTSRSTMSDALYRYDAIGRLHDAQMKREQRELHGQPGAKRNEAAIKKELEKDLRDIGRFIRLGPLGTALLPASQPRVLLVDEIDKSNIDLPNDLLHVFETGEYEIPELARLPEDLDLKKIEVQTHGEDRKVIIERGHVKCKEFPFVVLTSNGERELPPPFLRRCIRLNIDEPAFDDLARIVGKKFKSESYCSEEIKVAAETGSQGLGDDFKELIQDFIDRRPDLLSTDQLLNAIFLRMQGVDLEAPLLTEEEAKKRLQTVGLQLQEHLRDAIFKPLKGT